MNMPLSITTLSYLTMGFFALLLTVKSLNPLSKALKSFSFTDIYYQIKSQINEPDTSSIVTIVDITHVLRRGDNARLILDIEAAHPRVLGVDAVFEGEKLDFKGNDSLVRAVEAYDNIVFSSKLMKFNETEKEFTQEIHSFFSSFIDVKEGFTNVARGGLYDSMKRTLTRRAKSMGRECPSFSAYVTSEYVGKDIWREGEEDVHINFSPKRFRVLKPEEVRSHLELIEDKIVMMGAMYDDVDSHWTPMGKIAGVELQAYSIQTLLEKKEIQELPLPLTYLLSFGLSLIFCCISLFFRRKTETSKNLFVRFILGSSYALSIVTFLFTTTLVGITFVIFASTNITINLTWALSSLAFMGTSTNMYKALYDFYKEHRKQNRAEDGSRQIAETT